MNEVLAFWFAYVLTRPLGASIADWLGKPKDRSGVGLGDGRVSLVFGALIVVCVVVMTRTVAADERRAAAGSEHVDGSGRLNPVSRARPFPRPATHGRVR